MIPNPRLVAQLQRRAEEGFYGDTAYLLIDVPTGMYDSYNQEIVTVSQIPIKCSFTDKPSQENWQDYADIGNIDAEIRFHGPTPSKGNKMKVTGRFGTQTYHDQIFEIIGIQDRGVFGFVCALKAIQI